MKQLVEKMKHGEMSIQIVLAWNKYKPPAALKTTTPYGVAEQSRKIDAFA